ncbi:MAG TPA: VOC family protein [Chitinophagaceae bacterium]|nr:VOC family protein [Chitinophagaceae bacterium]
MVTINPYLTFNGNCREAMTFYHSCLGGDLFLQSVEESPMAKEWPASTQKNILHSSITNGSVLLLASDMGAGGVPDKGNIICIAVSFTDEQQLKTTFSGLSEGGKITRPLHSFFGGTIGTLTDRFGIDWIFYYKQEIQ